MFVERRIHADEHIDVRDRNEISRTPVAGGLYDRQLIEIAGSGASPRSIIAPCELFQIDGSHPFHL
jgi:hypothetical protein